MAAVTFVEILRARSDGQPDHVAFTFLPDGETDRLQVTYAELDRRARTIAGRLQSMASPGDRALLVFPPGIEFIAAFMGCMYAGVVAAPVFPPGSSGSASPLTAIVRDCQPRVVLTTGRLAITLAARIPIDGCVVRPAVLATDTGETGNEDDWTYPPDRPGRLAYLQYTSGSTGTPRGVRVTHANLVHNSAEITARCRIDADTPGVSWLPPYHDMGLIGSVLQPIYSGFHMSLMPPLAFVRRPMRWLQAISRDRAVLSVAPNFAYDLCTRDPRSEPHPELDLSSWRIALVGAEPIRADTLDRFTEAFAGHGFRRRTFIPCYGLAEATLMVSGVPRDAGPTIRSVDRDRLTRGKVVETAATDPPGLRLVSCGPAIGAQRLVVANPDTGRRCAPAEVGEVWVSGPSVTQGYWNSPDDTAAVFGAHLGDTGEGPFLRTGDLGVVIDDELYITGRLKDLIIVHGRNYHPSDIELTVANSHPALRHGYCAAFSVEVEGEERLVVVQEVKPTVPASDCASVVDDIRQAVMAGHRLTVHDVVLVDRGSVPKTMTGKVRRAACRTAYAGQTMRVRHRDALAVPRPYTTGPDAAADPVPAAEGRRAWLVRLLAAAPDECRTLLTGHLGAKVAHLVGMDTANLDAGRPLNSLGIDSMMAVELRNQITADLGVAVPVEAFLVGSTLDGLVTTVMELLADPGSRPAGGAHLEAHATTATPVPPRLDELSDGDVDALLHQVLGTRMMED